MRHHNGLAVLGMIGATWIAMAAEAPIPPEIENQAITGINKQPPHATLMPYATLDEALAARRHVSSYCRSLNGMWRFNWVPHPAQRPVDFYRPDFDVSNWKEIPVPSCWQLEGYGTAYYLNATYPFKVDPPRVMGEPPRNWTAYEERNPVGSYRRDFDLPAEWQGRRVFITFDGVDSAFYLWVNGERVGYSTDSRTPAEFDITDFVKPGKNTLAAEVYRFSMGSYLEDQDMFRLSGIYRNVTLWSAPQVHVRDFFVKPDLDAEYRDGTLSVTAKVRNYGQASAEGRRLSIALYDAAGEPVAGAQSEVAVPALGPGEEQAVSATLAVANPAKWTAETPNLYTVVLSLQSGDATKELLSCRVGFRKVEIRGRVFTINGVPVKLKGTNRHENWPDTGHAVTEAQMIRDLELIKQANMNHVRTSHYSDDPRWYELCDEYGIYLVAESNVEDHGCHAVTQDASWEKVFVEREQAAVERDKNHPSVVIWSLGNECGSGRNMHAALAAVRAIDGSRPVHYEGFGIGRNNPADIDSQMYAHPSWVDRVAQDRGFTKPYYLCEYAHAMSNSMGAIGDYNDIIDRHEELMGGAIWEWQDQALWNRRDPAKPFLAYGGGFGDVPNDGVFILKGVVFADRQLTPKYPEAKKAYQWVAIEPEDLAVGTVRIRNKYAFTNLKKFRGSWEVSEDGTATQRGELERLDLAPGATATVRIPYRQPEIRAGVEAFLRVSFCLDKPEVWAPAGYEIASEQLALPVRVRSNQAANVPGPLTATETDATVTIGGGPLRVVFSKADGAMTELSYGGENLLRAGGGPQVWAWRAPHLNDDLWAAGSWRGVGLSALQAKVLGVSVTQPRPEVVQVRVATDLAGNGQFAISQSTVYTVFGDGEIAVDSALVPRGPRIVVPRLGMRLLLDKRLDQVAWFGRGPMENYSDRKRGSDVGLYRSAVAQQLTPYVRPMECGNHEDVRWVALTDGNGEGLLAICEGGVMQASALPFTDEQLATAAYARDLPASEASVLCLSARTLGVGSAGCGPRPLDQYITYSDPVTFSYLLRPVGAGETGLAALARRGTPMGRVAPVLAVRNVRQGTLALSCATPGAKLELAVNDGPWQDYVEPVKLQGEAVVSFRASTAELLPFQGKMLCPRIVDRSGWKIVSCDSYERGEGEPEHILDGDPGTYWHTRWRPDSAPYPHEFVVDFGEVLSLTGIVYEAREDMDHGRVRDFEVYLSGDGKEWGPPAVTGRFENRTGQQRAILPKPMQARYLRFVAKSEIQNRAWASMAELSVTEGE